MTCLRESNQGADVLIGYLEGTLPEAGRRELERHAAGCAECRQLLAVLAELGAYEAPEVSAGFDAKLYARIAAEQARRPWWSVSWRVLAPSLAAAVLVVAVWVRQQEPAPEIEMVVTDPEVLQLEQALDDVELLMPLSGAERL